MSHPDDVADGILREQVMGTRNYAAIILADRAAVWRAACLACESQLRETIRKLYGGKARINQVDRHVAEVLATKADAMLRLADSPPTEAHQ